MVSRQQSRGRGGAPLVVYHGTNIAFQDFQQRGSAHRLTKASWEPALLQRGQPYRKLLRDARPYKAGMEAWVYPVCLSMQNPLVISTDAGNVQDKLRQASAQMGVSLDPVLNRESNARLIPTGRKRSHRRYVRMDMTA